MIKIKIKNQTQGRRTRIYTSIIGAMEVCSPSASKTFKTHNTCFSKEALVRIAEIWNMKAATNNNKRYGPIKGISRKSANQLWHDINARMTQPCQGSGREWCWIDKLGTEAKSTAVIASSLRPVTPREWYKKPYTWLSNYDIAAVMKQYDVVADASYNYKFLGVFPIDFTSKDEMGQCLYSEICQLDLSKFIRKGVKYIGLITNMDKHDEPGSHWTSTFVCIDPNTRCYGGYYYDSVSRETPESVTEFFAVVQKQLAKLYPQSVAVFNTDYSKQVEQRGNTECGMFSIAYQLRWLKALRKKQTALLSDVLKTKMNDAYVHKLRKTLFIPSATEVVKPLK